MTEWFKQKWPLLFVLTFWLGAGYLVMDRWAAKTPPHTTGFAQAQGSSLHTEELP